MPGLTKSAHSVLDRLQAVIDSPPTWQRTVAVEAIQRHYELLGVTVPDPIVVDSEDEAYSIAYRALSRRSSGMAWDIGMEMAQVEAMGSAYRSAWEHNRSDAWSMGFGWLEVRTADPLLRAAGMAVPSLNAGVDDRYNAAWVELCEQKLVAVEHGLRLLMPFAPRPILVGG